MNERLVSEIKEEGRIGIVLSDTIYPIEPDEDEEFSIERDVMTNSVEATGISKDDYREMLINAAEAGRDSLRYWNLLVDIVKKSGYKSPVGRDVTVLDIGCGIAEEARTLNSFFGGKDVSERSETTTVIGIDTDEEKIKITRDWHMPTVSEAGNGLPPYFKFLHADATKLDQIEEIPEFVDVVIMRHPQFVGDPDKDSDQEYEKWATILKQSLGKLSETGIVFITTYNEADRDLVRKAANELGCQIKIDEENKWSKSKAEVEEELAAGVKGSLPQDRHVIILQK